MLLLLVIAIFDVHVERQTKHWLYREPLTFFVRKRWLSQKKLQSYSFEMVIGVQITYMGCTNKLVSKTFCYLRWYQILAWPMDNLLHMYNTHYPLLHLAAPPQLSPQPSHSDQPLHAAQAPVNLATTNTPTIPLLFPPGSLLRCTLSTPLRTVKHGWRCAIHSTPVVLIVVQIVFFCLIM